MLSDKAKKARRLYMKQYREANKEKLAEYQRDHYKKNPDKYKEYRERYWIKKAAEELHGGII